MRCGATCTTDFRIGEVVTLTVSSSCRPAFAGWGGADNSIGVLLAVQQRGVDLNITARIRMKQ
jgi:hypothetical protein